MAIYISDSSRRFPEPPQEELEKKWEESLGKPKGAVCNVCGKKSSDGKLVNGKCRTCRNDPFCGCPAEFRKLIEDEMNKTPDEILKESMEASDLRDSAESSGAHQNDY